MTSPCPNGGAVLAARMIKLRRSWTDEDDRRLLVVRPLSWASRRTRTCCGTPVDSPWPTRGMIRGLCRPISGTGTSSTRFAIPSCHPIASRISGGENVRQIKRICIIKHEAVPGCGSSEVRFPAGCEAYSFIYWDDIPARRLRPGLMAQETAREKAKAAARAAEPNGEV
jgi:hypothetical protein